MTTGQTGREERIGNTVERPNAACRHFRPARWVALARPPVLAEPSFAWTASDALTVVPLRSAASSWRIGCASAMPLRVLVNRSG